MYLQDIYVLVLSSTVLSLIFKTDCLGVKLGKNMYQISYSGHLCPRDMCPCHSPNGSPSFLPNLLPWGLTQSNSLYIKLTLMQVNLHVQVDILKECNKASIFLSKRISWIPWGSDSGQRLDWGSLVNFGPPLCISSFIHRRPNPFTPL